MLSYSTHRLISRIVHRPAEPKREFLYQSIPTGSFDRLRLADYIGICRPERSVRFFANVNVAPWLRSGELFLLSESGRSPGEEVRFAPDSSVAGAGFEPSVPLTTTLREISRSTFLYFSPRERAPF